MDDKPRTFTIVMIWLALVTSAVLVLVDYKLKRDLLTLFGNIQKALYGQELPDTPPDRGSHTDPVRADDLVADNTGMEAANGHRVPSADSVQARDPATGQFRRRDGDTEIPPPDKPLGT